MIQLVPDSSSDGAVEAVKRLQAAGFIAFMAGGCVRDMLLGRKPKDYDVATDAVPSEVLRLFPGSVAVGKAFGVIRARLGGQEYEIATFRKDHSYSDGRRPDAVTFSDPGTDATRRDFTMNALFFDPVSGVIHDFVGGRADIEKKIVRAVGCPDERFMEDHLRMIRAVRFECTLGFSMDGPTFDAMVRNAPLAAKISSERIQQELTRILLESPRAGAAVERLRCAGLLKHFLPEVEAMKGQEQPPEFHPEGDVYTHTLMMLDAMEKPTIRLAYAVLLHDIGKPSTARHAGDRIRFDNHARRGAEMAEEIMRRLRFPVDDIRAVSFCVGNHMRFMDVRKMRRSTLARLVGAPTFAVEHELHRLDCAASHGDQKNYEFLAEYQAARRSKPVLPEPFVTGKDIMALGVPHGPKVGRWKKIAYDAQLEKGFEDRDAALEWLKRMLPPNP